MDYYFTLEFQVAGRYVGDIECKAEILIDADGFDIGDIWFESWKFGQSEWTPMVYHSLDPTMQDLHQQAVDDLNGTFHQGEIAQRVAGEFPSRGFLPNEHSTYIGRP